MKLPKQKITILTFTCLTAVFLFNFFSKKISAQDKSKLTVAPSRQEITIDPGETAAINVKFFNQENKPISGKLAAVDFIVIDKEGSPLFLDLETIPEIVGLTQIPARFSAASWISLPYEQITIAANDKVNINAKITAPADAKSGGKYIAIYFEPGGAALEASNIPTEAGSPIAVRIAGLIYIRVSGPIDEEARLVQFTTPRFSEYGPVPVVTEILNLGNYHIRPQGFITLTDMLGRKTAEVQLDEVNIFPEVSRTLKNEVGQKWMFGKYKAELNAAYGETGQVLTGTVFFWVFPWKVALALTLALIIAALTAVLIYHRVKVHEEELEDKIEELEKELGEKK